MLELVGRLAGFGISAIMATHLLDDVQRVCEHVVMIDRGNLVLAGPIDQLIQRTGVMRVEVGGRPGAVAALVDALASRHIHATPVHGTDGAEGLEGLAGPGGQTVDVDTTHMGEEAFDVVRDAIAGLNLRLYSLSTRHRSLDDLFLQQAAAPGART
jgi:ABC-2 type transport system ATP-binding protein